jgi:manganese/iron transport system substrate-binding protein
MRHRRVGRPALLLLVVSIAACGPAPTNSSGLVRVVTTTTVFADMVASVGGNLVEVTSLVPKNGDVHTFEPKPADIRAVAQADLLVMNGLGLDDWLEKTIANASKKGTALLKLGVDLGVPLLPGEEPGTQNPHLWLDVNYAKQYVDRIVVGLQATDRAHSNQYQRQGAAYRARLDELDRWVREQVASIPESNRKIVTFHDAFPYYAREYGITIAGVAVQAPGQDPSAGDTAALVEAIRAAGVKAIFSEAQFPAKLVEQLAGETGTTVVADLYDDSVGDPPVTTYEAVVRWDTQQLVDALR